MLVHKPPMQKDTNILDEKPMLYFRELIMSLSSFRINLSCFFCFFYLVESLLKTGESFTIRISPCMTFEMSILVEVPLSIWRKWISFIWLMPVQSRVVSFLQVLLRSNFLFRWVEFHKALCGYFRAIMVTTLLIFGWFYFGWILWHINHCRLIDAKSSYISYFYI